MFFFLSFYILKCFVCSCFCRVLLFLFYKIKNTNATRFFLHPNCLYFTPKQYYIYLLFIFLPPVKIKEKKLRNAIMFTFFSLPALLFTPFQLVYRPCSFQGENILSSELVLTNGVFFQITVAELILSGSKQIYFL